MTLSPKRSRRECQIIQLINLSIQTKMSAFATGAFAGVLVQLYSNGVRKLPLMRRKFQTLFNEYFSTITSRRRNPLFFFYFTTTFHNLLTKSLLVFFLSDYIVKQLFQLHYNYPTTIQSFKTLIPFLSKQLRTKYIK